MKIWQANYWWGAGPAHFDHLFRIYRDPHVQARADRVHNDYLNTLADWGVVGAVLRGLLEQLAEFLADLFDPALTLGYVAAARLGLTDLTVAGTPTPGGVP